MAMIGSTPKQAAKTLNEDELTHISIIAQLKQYLETRIRLARYQLIAKSTAIAAELFADITILFCFLLVFIFASFTAAFLFAGLFKSNWAGFGCVTLLYLLLAFCMKLSKKAIERPLVNILITKLLKSNGDDKERK